MFEKILIANRGAIACRIIRTLRRMGLKSVAVYTEADALSRHVMEADEAFCIGSGAASESYLRADKILDIAKHTGASKRNLPSNVPHEEYVSLGPPPSRCAPSD